MTTFITTANQSTYQVAGVAISNLASLEQIVLASGATVNSTGSTAILAGDTVSGTGESISLLLMGSVLSGGGPGVWLKLNGNKVMVSSSGVVFGQNGGILLSESGIGSSGSNFVENRGLVTTTAGIGISAKLSDNYLANLGTVEAAKGILAGSSGSSNNIVVNSGSIFSSGTGVELWGTFSSLTNSGLIRSSAANAIVVQSQAGETITVLNTGTIEGGGSYAILSGAGSDQITNKGKIVGSIELGAGDDTFDGRGGDVEYGLISLGSGNDIAYADDGGGGINCGLGNDTVYGGAKVDAVSLGEGDDVAFGGDGDDSFQYFNVVFLGSDTIDGGSGVDSISLAAGFTEPVTINLNLTSLQLVSAGWGSIQLKGIEDIDGSGGNDLLIGNSAANTFAGVSGDDTLEGGLGNDVLDGSFGFDFARFTGSAGAKVSLASTSAQVTGYGTDTFIDIEGLMGGSGADNFIGSTGDNRLYGNAGNDALSGGNGLDILYGGAGNDKLTGGAQADLFVFNTGLNAKVNVDAIVDFIRADDTIHLDNAVFKKLGSGSAASPAKLSASFFVTGSKAKDKNDHIVYDKVTGALYYDADGSGKGAAIKFAQLKKGASLALDDFFVI